MNRTTVAFIKHVRLSIFNDPYEAVSRADALTPLMACYEFRRLPPRTLTRTVRGTIVLDTHNVFVSDAIGTAGFVYLGRGRGPKGSISVFAASATAGR